MALLILLPHLPPKKKYRMCPFNKRNKFIFGMPAEWRIKRMRVVEGADPYKKTEQMRTTKYAGRCDRCGRPVVAPTECVRLTNVINLFLLCPPNGEIKVFAKLSSESGKKGGRPVVAPTECVRLTNVTNLFLLYPPNGELKVFAKLSSESGKSGKEI